MKRVVTRIYFPDEEEANTNDPVLSSVEDLEVGETKRPELKGEESWIRIHEIEEGKAVTSREMCSTVTRSP